MSAYKDVTPDQLQTWLGSGEAVIIDVREPGEFAAEHIKGAVNIPLSSFEAAQLGTIEAEKVVFQCASGNRSCRALDKVPADAGGKALYNLDGGITAWKAAQLPTEKSGKSVLPLDRQVQIILGALILLFGLLGYFASNAFLFVPIFIGAGLLNAGLTGWCGMALLVAKAPWNR